MRGHPFIERVVVVVLDGLRPDAITTAGLRNWQQLARQGAASLSGATVAPSVTAAAMASLLTGALPEIHGLQSDRFHLPRPRGPLHPLPGVLARAGLPSSGFVLLHWPDADQAGHAHGWMSSEYAAAAQRLDDCLGELATHALDDPHTLLIGLADHGGGGVDPRDHDSSHPFDRTVPIVLAGDAVLGEELHEPELVDVPATVLWALGVPLPESYVGRPLSEAFLPAARLALG